jgi:hypothetical protein
MICEIVERNWEGRLSQSLDEVASLESVLTSKECPILRDEIRERATGNVRRSNEGIVDSFHHFMGQKGDILEIRKYGGWWCQPGRVAEHLETDVGLGRETIHYRMKADRARSILRAGSELIDPVIHDSIQAENECEMLQWK